MRGCSMKMSWPTGSAKQATPLTLNSSAVRIWKKKKKAPVKRKHGNIRSAAAALSQSVSAEGHGVIHTGRPTDKNPVRIQHRLVYRRWGNGEVLFCIRCHAKGNTLIPGHKRLAWSSQNSSFVLVWGVGLQVPYLFRLMYHRTAA